MSPGPTGSGTTSSSIDAPKDSDWFRIDLRAGELCRFSVDSHLSFLDPFLSLHTASGTLVQTALNGGSKAGDPVLVTRVSASGTYFLEVGDQGLVTGDYTVNAEEVPANVATYSTVAPGERVRRDIQDLRITTGTRWC